MVNQYLSARRPLNLMAGIRFAAGMGVELNSFSPRLAAELELALKVAPQARGEGIHQSDYATIRCVQLQLQAGRNEYKIRSLPKVGAFIAFRNDWLKQRNYDSHKLLAIPMNDEGMRPTLAQNDLIVVNTADTAFADTAVFAVNYEGDVLIRRIVRDAASWWLYCDNPDAQRFPKKVWVDKHCYIIGKVIHRQSESI
ncbi:hypothetical protein DLREEDagrD3_27870 [Denitratisoma sp. agr-D3]